MKNHGRFVDQQGRCDSADVEVFFVIVLPPFNSLSRKWNTPAAISHVTDGEMSVLDDIGQERQRLVERLTKIDADRPKLVEELVELEAAERVLSPFIQAGSAQWCGIAKISLADATLRAVETHSSSGISAEDIRRHLADEFGLQVRPNHLGMALQRHRRAGRLEQHDSLWFRRQSAGEEAGLDKQRQ